MAGSAALERLRASDQRAQRPARRPGADEQGGIPARASGLSRTTVSSLVAELIRAWSGDRDRRPARPHKGGSGRPPVQVRLSAPAGGVVGVDVGHGHVRVAVAVAAGPYAPRSTPWSTSTRTAPRVLDPGQSPCHGPCASLREGDLDLRDLQAVGMCVPALLDRAVLPDPDRHHAGLAGAAARRGAGATARRTRACRQRRQPRRARRAAPRQRAWAARRRPTGRSPAVSARWIVLGGRLNRGAQRHRRGDRSRPGRRGRPRSAAAATGGRVKTMVSAARLLALLQPTYGEAVLTIEHVLALDEEGDTWAYAGCSPPPAAPWAGPRRISPTASTRSWSWSAAPWAV